MRKVKKVRKPETKEEAVQYIKNYCKQNNLECVWIDEQKGEMCTLEMRHGETVLRYEMTKQKRADVSYSSFFKLIKKMHKKIDDIEWGNCCE